MPSAKTIPADASVDHAERIPAPGSPGELSAAEERARASGQLRRIAALKLRPHPDQPADRHASDSVKELAVSIKTHGLLQPPLVSRRADGDLIILAGHRRSRAYQLLVLEGRADERLPAYVIEGLTIEEERDFMLAELMHRDTDFSPVAVAENIGRKWRSRQLALGRDISVRDLADCIPSAEKTSVAEYLIIFEALQDPRLATLVRQADKAGKSLLYKALCQDEISDRTKALKAFSEGGSKAMRQALKKKRAGRPRQVVTRKSRGEKGYDVTIRFRHEMPQDEVDEAIAALRALEADLSENHSSAKADAAA